MIQAVLFDIDGVLIDSFEANFAFLRELIEKAGYRFVSREKYTKMFHMTMEHIIAEVTQSNDSNEIARILQMGKDRAVPYREELLTISDSLRSTIEVLSAKYVLGIVTSRIRNGIFTLSALRDLESFFKVVVCFEDTDKHKPDPTPLLLACKRLNIASTEAVYVGDMQTDIDAANAAGMQSIAFTRQPLLGARAQCSEMSELPATLDKLFIR